MITLPSTLHHNNANALLAQGLQSIKQAEATISVNAADLQQFDSSALAVLLAWQRAALQSGKTLTCRNMPDSLRNLAHIYDMGTLFSA